MLVCECVSYGVKNMLQDAIVDKKLVLKMNVENL